jgi:hypothetical protein
MLQVRSISNICGRGSAGRVACRLLSDKVETRSEQIGVRWLNDRAKLRGDASLAGNRARPICADVDSEDLDGRADHLEKVFAALHVYLTAIIADMARDVPGGALDRHYLDNLLRDWSVDALCMIRNAAEEMREHENWRAS